MGVIPLKRRNGSVRAEVLVDDEDFERFGHLRWCWNNGYAFRIGEQRRALYLHREIMGLVRGDGREVDHRDRNRLDCRRSNLIVTVRKGNAANVPSLGGTSKHRGICRRGERWQAYVNIDGRFVSFGYYDDEEVAAKVAREARRQHLRGSVD